MTSPDSDKQVFIVRLWYEPREIEGAQPVLRGTVMHVPSGDQQAVSSIWEVSTVIGRRMRDQGGEMPDLH